MPPNGERILPNEIEMVWDHGWTLIPWHELREFILESDEPIKDLEIQFHGIPATMKITKRNPSRLHVKLTGTGIPRHHRRIPRIREIYINMDIPAGTRMRIVPVRWANQE